MRLINADELMRSHCVECTYYNSGECLGENCDWDSIGHIREAKTVDAVPVVRCKDCVYCSSLFPVCTYNGRCEPVNADDFCSKGERK